MVVFHDICQTILVSGESGAGKTHLLQAAQAYGGHYMDAQQDPDWEQEQDQEQEQNKNPTNAPFWLIDHLEHLSPSGQQTLFNQFNRLQHQGGRLLVASRQPPQQLRWREDLRTRLGSGLIFRLHPLSDAEKISALDAQAQARGMHIPPTGLDYLITHAPRDMRSLSAILIALDQLSLEQQRPLTLPLLRQALHNTLEQKTHGPRAL